MKRFRQSLAGQNRDSGVGVTFVEDSKEEDEVKGQPRRSLGRRTYQPADIIISMAKAEVGLHMYSGHPKDTRYDNGNVERYTVDAWCTRLEMVTSSAGWNSRAQAASGQMVPSRQGRQRSQGVGRIQVKIPEGVHAGGKRDGKNLAR